MSDIVYELRSLEVRADVAYHGDESRLFNSTMRAAAEEIERLRTQGNGLADRVGSLFRETQELYRHIATQQPWVPVSERLPDQHQEVIGWWGDTPQPHAGFAWIDDNGVWNSDSDYPDPTHWMPLPEPPEVK
jgi:hypothetical protein